jgi:hypothetical protein
MENQNLPQPAPAQQLTWPQQFAKAWQAAPSHRTATSAAVVAITTGEPAIGALYRQSAGKAQELVTLQVTEAIATYVSMLPTSRAVAAEACIAMGKAFADLTEVRNLTLGELKTFLELAFKRQAFGKLYGGFGYDTLVEWLNAYFDERTEGIVQHRENQHLLATQGEKHRRNRQEGDAWAAGDLINQNLNTPPTP